MHVVTDHVHFSELGQRQVRAEKLLGRQSRFRDV
jgi:hypothetical protein